MTAVNVCHIKFYAKQVWTTIGFGWGFKCDEIL